jgi:hypothetical protein
MGKRRPVYQFKIELDSVEPKVWRRIQVSDLYSFWDLHVAIADAMGWEDYHLHQFETKDPETKHRIFITMPDDEEWFPEDTVALADYDTKIRDFFSDLLTTMRYIYDFGDDWSHTITFEGIHEKQADTKYPVCLDGEYACPPEDVGGPHGYMNFLEAINNPLHDEHKSYLEWIGRKFNPKYFNPKKVKFDSPSRRLKITYNM